MLDETSTLGSMGPALRAIAATPSELLVRGTVIDEQYEIARVIGHGAMGVVYLARDRRLERNVAIKLVKEESPTALARASREAVALARLSHPNVVVIHQVGELAGRVYVAMEYVAGQTGREWAATTTRSVREILSVYLAVGEGLAAAHAAGLVHRDFKPDNVLVGDDGRTRVADFGLARSPATGEATTGAIEPITAHAGTPAYMAPEQVRGEVIDARADQFAYCTALWEALHGTRPFAGETAEQMCAAIAGEEPMRGEPERARRIPRHVDAALRRGLASDREARWPTLAALLGELRRDPARARRNFAFGAAVPVVAVGLYAATQHVTAPDPCDLGADRIAVRWNPGQVDTLRARLAPPGTAPWIERQARVAIDAMDHWTGRWRDSYRDVCRAGWSSSLRDRGTICLGRGEQALAATVDALSTPKLDFASIDDLVSALPRPEACTDPVYLSADVPPPSNPALAAAVASVEGQLERVGALVTAGHREAARALLAKVAHEPSLGYAPLAAELHLQQGMFTWRDGGKVARELLRDTYFEARAAGARATAARAAIFASTAALDASKDADAAMWSRLASVEAAALTDPQIRASALAAEAIVATGQTHDDRAIELATQGIELLETANLGDFAADLRQARAEAYDHLGNYPAALVDVDHALATLHARFGDALVTPRATALENVRSLLFVHMGRPDDAIAAAQESFQIAEQIDPDRGVKYVAAMTTLGVAYTAARRYDEALTLMERGLAADIAHEGPRTYNVASDYNNRCELLGHIHRADAAIADCKLALDIFTEVVGATAVEVADSAGNLSAATAAGARWPETIAAADRAIQIFAANPADPSILLPLIERSIAYRELGDLAKARADLERAAKFGATGASPALLALAQLELARLERRAGHAAAARAAATAARDRFAAQHDAEAQRAAATLLAELK